MHVLTVGEYTYTTDERFTARHNRATDEWVLVIKYVQERDAGVYECQIPTATSKAYPVQLNIVGECLVGSCGLFSRTPEQGRLRFRNRPPSFIIVIPILSGGRFPCFSPAGNFPHEGIKKSLDSVSWLGRCAPDVANCRRTPETLFGAAIE